MKLLDRLLASLLLAFTLILMPSAANAGVVAPPEVFAIGDSIFTRTGANTFGTEFPAALDRVSMVSSGIDANSGRSISSNGLTPALGSGLDAVTNHQSEIAAADILITDLGINDTEFGAEWEALARRYIADIKAANPSTTIAWITPVAEPGVAPVRFLNRGLDHAPIVRSLADEGLIDILVEWDTYALAHRDVFHIDGVHYWQTGDTVRYTNFAADWLASHYDPNPNQPTVPQLNGPAEAQVLRLYQAALGRQPDPAGLAYWSLRYRRGTPLADIASAFTASTEWNQLYGSTNDEAMVALLYNNALGRTPNQAEMAYWTAQLGAGLTRAQVLMSFADSPENIARTHTEAPLGAQASRVLRLYRAALGRYPDEGGLAYWSEAAARGLDMRSVATEFMASKEWRASYGTGLSHTQLIDLLYNNVLDRQGDTDGVNYWLDQMADGMAPVDVLIAFSDSAENRDRTGTR